MNGDTSSDHGFNLREILIGTGWGLGILMLSGVIQGIVSHGSPISTGLELVLAIIWQGMASLLAGFVAGRRAHVTGWLHGGLSGLFVILAVTTTMGVFTALPTLTALMKMSGIGLVLGAVGGAVGVGSR